jgi:hypothetical protein
MKRDTKEFKSAYHIGGQYFLPTAIYQLVCVHNHKKWIADTFDFNIAKYGQLYQLNKGIHSCKELQEDFNKYGENGFFFMLLEKFIDVNELKSKLDYYRIKYNASYYDEDDIQPNM